MQHSNNHTPTIPRWETATILLIVIWAAVLRCGWLGTNSFSFDEARVSQLALLMARGGEFAELGMQSSTGFPNFPGAVWLMALPYFFSPDPLWATLFVAIISTVATYGIWWLARQAWDGQTAIIVALIYAASPYVVFYSRNIWSQNLLAPAAILWAVTAVIGIRNKKWWALILHAFLSGFTAQLHLAGVALVLGSLWLGVRFRLWRQWKPVAIGIVLGVMAALPTLSTIWFYGDGARAVFSEISDQPSQVDWSVFAQLFSLGIANGWETMWLNASWVWPAGLELGLTTGQWVLVTLYACGIIAAISRGYIQGFGQGKTADDHLSAELILSVLLPIWLLSAPLFFLRSKTPAFIQYQLVSLPAWFLLAGAAVAVLQTRFRQIALGIVCVIALFQTVAVVQTLNTIDDTLVDGGMGTPLAYPRAAIERLTASDRTVAVHAIGAQREFDGDAAVFDVLLWGHAGRIVDGRSNLIIPAGPATILSTFDSVPAWQMVTDLGIDGRSDPQPRRQNEPAYMALQIEQPSAEQLGFTPVDAALQNGAILTGWQMTELQDGRIRLITYWEVKTAATSDRFQQFNHLYTTKNPDQPTAVSDVTTSSHSWHEGDHLIVWADFPPIPPDGAEITHFDVGMYTWPDLQRSPVLDREGDPLLPIRLVPQNGR